MAVKAENKDVGDRAVPQWTWAVAGANTDPTQIVIKQQDADGVESTVTTAATPSALTPSSSPLARVSVGVFKLNPGVALTKAGYWLIRAESTGTAEAAAPDFLYKVAPTEFYDNAGLTTRALVNLQETKDWLQHQNIDTPDMLELVRVINDISERFHDVSAREIKVVGTNPQTRYFDADTPAVRYGIVAVGDLTSFTTVRLLDRDLNVQETVAAGDIISLPRNRAAWEPIRRLRFTADVTNIRPDWVIEVAGAWGFPAVPGNVRQAVLDAVADTMDRDVEHYRTDLSPRAAEGGGTILQVTQRPMFLSLPPSALAVARSFRDPLVA